MRQAGHAGGWGNAVLVWQSCHSGHQVFESVEGDDVMQSEAEMIALGMTVKNLPKLDNIRIINSCISLLIRYNVVNCVHN